MYGLYYSIDFYVTILIAIDNGFKLIRNFFQDNIVIVNTAIKKKNIVNYFYSFSNYN